jgi:signal transduction histidine kinase
MTEDGTLTIRAQLENNGNSRKVFLDVEDTGIGVPESHISKIFNPFFTSRKEKGFGLGLFISRIIVEKHRGKIYAQSKEGQGTIIRVEFPV